MALSGTPVPARGFIVVVPAIHDLDALVSDIESAVHRRVRGWVVTGERDYGRDKALTLGERLNDLSVPCHVEVIPDLGHDFPSDFADRRHQHSRMYWNRARFLRLTNIGRDSKDVWDSIA
jgi:acetyl esterase/lipase